MDREVQNEYETLDKDEQAVSRLVSGLKHLEAPANFERRVMARIAERPVQHNSRLSFRVIGYAVPALLVLLIATFFIFKLRETSQNQNAPIVAGNMTIPPDPAPSIDPTQVPEQPTIAQSQPAPVQNIVPGTEPKTAKQNRDLNSNRGGSYDEALPNKKAPMPVGLQNGPPLSANRADVTTPTVIQVSDVLDMMGISTSPTDQWRVTAVRENSTSAKSGVKVGDVVTALDDTDINTLKSFNSFGSIHMITVRRDGRSIPLKLTTH